MYLISHTSDRGEHCLTLFSNYKYNTFAHIITKCLYGALVEVCKNYDTSLVFIISLAALLWRHNGLESVSKHQPHECLLNRSFGRRSRKHQSSASLAFVREIHRRPVNFPRKCPVTRKMFLFDDVIKDFIWLIQHAGRIQISKASQHGTDGPSNNSHRNKWKPIKVNQCFTVPCHIVENMALVKFDYTPTSFFNFKLRVDILSLANESYCYCNWQIDNYILQSIFLMILVAIWIKS